MKMFLLDYLHKDLAKEILELMLQRNVESTAKPH